MKYVCNRCSNVFQADEITIHYTKDVNGFEIIAICPSCLGKYLEKTKGAFEEKEDDIKRSKIPRKW